VKTGDTQDRSAWHLPPKSVVSVVIPGKKVPIIVHWSFLLFVSTLPFEAADLSFASGSFSLSKISGLLFFMCYFFFYNPFLSHLPHRRSFPQAPTALWCFLAYVIIYILNGSFVSVEFIPKYIGRFITLVQLIIFFWIGLALLKEEKIMKGTLIAYSVSSAILALCMILRLPGFSESMTTNNAERYTALGFGSNDLANLLALAAVMLIGSYRYVSLRPLLIRICLMIMILPLLVGIVKTGSRTGIAVFLIGLSIYLLPLWKGKSRFAIIIFAIFYIGTMIYMVLYSPDASLRWQRTIEEGDLSGRSKIYFIAADMIAERPIFGWHAEFGRELGRRLGYRQSSRDAHSLYLHLFLEVGAIGAIPFLIGLWLCARAAWKARLGGLGLMPLACLFTVLAANMTNTYLVRKPLWLVLALTFAAASIAAKEQQKPRGILIVRKPLRSGGEPPNSDGQLFLFGSTSLRSL
jgi:O-antigen ligase